jgi:methyl-accepting chemotaxis protein
MIQLKKEKSRLKKKLTLYFILIAVVSISVSVEMIFEFSSANFRNDIRNNLIIEVQNGVPAGYIQKLNVERLDSAINDPISDLRNRMILLLLVVFASIVGAFIMFAKDIVSPMDGIVEATKKIADGDLTVMVPVMSDDEIGQIATLINDMNINLQDMIMQIRQEITRHKNKIEQATKAISYISQKNADEIIENKKMKISDFKKMTKLSLDVVRLLEGMLIDLGALETFVKMYKTYAVHTEINQRELDKVLDQYNVKLGFEDED